MQPVGIAGYRVHDLVWDFVKDRIKSAPLEKAASRQAKYLGRLDVVLRHANNRGSDPFFFEGDSLMAYFPLAALWRSVEEVSSNTRLQVDTYGSSLKSLGEEESEDAADVYWAVGSLLEFQVRIKCGKAFELNSPFLEKRGFKKAK